MSVAKKYNKATSERPDGKMESKAVKGATVRTPATSQGKASLAVVPDGEIVEGVNQYKIDSLIKKGNVYNLYKVKDVDQENLEYLMKTCAVDRGRLKLEATLLSKANKLPGDKVFVDYIEFGSMVKYKLDFLTTVIPGPTLEEVRYRYLKTNLSIACGLRVIISCLKGIQDLHKLGYLHRNIRPAAFHIGHDQPERIFITDFRIIRNYLDKSRKHLPARPTVKFLGTIRYASRSAHQQKDQGRKDDLESLIYMMFHLIDENTIVWKKIPKDKVLAAKDGFFRGVVDNIIFSNISSSFRRLLDYVDQLQYQLEPDYSYVSTFLTTFIKENKLDTTACDWKSKIDDKMPEVLLEQSFDNHLTGELDDIKGPGGGGGKKGSKQIRKKMHPGDVIKSDVTGWKVVNLLGSGGFGDVYKVYKDGGDKNKMYALKTEGEQGDRRMLRLKVEVGVLMKCWTPEAKAKKFGHFVEFIDRGRCEALKCKFVVMGLIGPSLEDIRRKYLCCPFSKHTVFNAAVQTVEAVQDIHGIGFLHRDIKPANYAVGLADCEHIIYMLDFGIARMYQNADGTHKAPRKKVKFLGTIRFSSRACMKQIDQGRKDDLECWLMMVFDMLDENNGMPWKRLSVMKEILASKNEFFKNQVPTVYKSIPKTMQMLVEYIDKLEYASDPDYGYIITFLKTCAKDNNFKIDRKLDWINKLKKKVVQDSDSDKSEDGCSGESGSE